MPAPWMLARSPTARGSAHTSSPTPFIKPAIAAEAVGGRLVVVDAIDDSAADFYRHLGFEPIATDEHRMELPTKTLGWFLP
jgi:hypothetical protein